MNEEESVANETAAPASPAAKESKQDGPVLHKVRPTNTPDVEIEVDDRELADLKAMGFLPADDEKKGR